LHDTIEDSIEEKKVTLEMLKDRFGENVASLVLSVTETDKSLSWEERKKLAKEHIKDFSNDAVLVKSADILANTSEILEDYKKEGDQIFTRFNGSKEKVLINYLETITLLVKQWTESPLAQELKFISFDMAKIVQIKNTIKKIEYKDYNKNEILECPLCKWE
jgi:(p)ppGpp synthase/HD superfamily hydrolase